jgi:hypothetical protein
MEDVEKEHKKKVLQQTGCGLAGKWRGQNFRPERFDSKITNEKLSIANHIKMLFKK